MTHPLKTGPDDDRWRTLPEICMVLHMTHNCACGDLTDAEYEEAVAYVSGRVEKWHPNLNGSRNNLFDTQVLGLCLATLEESKRYVRSTKVSASTPG